MDELKPGTIVLNGASLDLSYSGIVPVADRDRVLEISNLLTSRMERRQNHASILMQELCQQADQARKLLLVMPEAFDVGGPTTAQLVAWYCLKFGFELMQQEPTIILYRTPK